jgi:hypothetical protein
MPRYNEPPTAGEMQDPAIPGIDCECRIDGDGVVLCELHEAAPELLVELQHLHTLLTQTAGVEQGKLYCGSLSEAQVRALLRRLEKWLPKGSLKD